MKTTTLNRHFTKSPRMTNARPRICKLPGHRGFALVVTLSLMILLTVIAVGLLTLSSIALRTSSRGDAMATARANARLAMMLALGDLQKHAGPDQGVTARADILDTTEPTKSKWTGAWNMKGPNSTPSAAAGPPAWLVSGNNPSNTGAAPTQAAIAAKTAVQMVGPGSTDTSVAGNEIIVDLATIRSTAASAVSGACGWWVADEGVKARVNLSDPRFDSTLTADRLVRNQAPAGSVVNKLTSFTGIPVTGDLNQAMVKAISDSQMRLVSPAILPAGLKTHFHDTGTYSEGVLANVREGGLKRDLNRALYDTTPPVTGSIFTDAGGAGPNWDIARSWVKLKVDTSSGFPTAPLVQPHRESNQSSGAVAQHGVGPIISRWGIEWWARIERVTGNPGAPLSTYKLGVGIRPVLQLSNPYNVRLPATTYRISHNFGHDGGVGGIRWKVGTSDLEYSWATLLGLPTGSNLLNGLGVNNGNRPWIHYKTPPVALEPGESVIFMPTGSNWTNPVQADEFNLLARGENSGGGVLRFPILTPPGTVTWEQLNAPDMKEKVDFRFGENNGPSWSGSGRNYTVNLAVDDGKTPASLVSNIGEPLSRMERIGDGKFEQSWWVANARSWAQSGNTTGQRFQVFDYYLGNDIVSYYSSATQNRPWMRDFSPRFPFPGAPDGQPLVNGSVDGNPWRHGRIWGIRYGHSGWHTRIDPTEFPPGSGSVIWGTQSAPPIGQARIVLYDLPTGDLLSPGQLQHVNLGGRDRPLRSGNRVGETANSSKPGQAATIQPTYIVGNSYRDPAVALGDVTYDWSYRANQEIWDRWFASGIPTTLTAAELASGNLTNPRMRPLQIGQLAEVKNINTAAANLVVEGMFNLNSTSVEAWKALLGSTANGSSPVAAPGDTSLSFDPSSGADTAARYARTLITNQVAGGGGMSTVGGDPLARWSGPVKLSDAQLTDLAKGIVQRIKNQTKIMGRPFASLSEFINRPADKELGLLQETFDQKSLPPGTPDGISLSGGRLNTNFLGQFKTGTVEQEGAPGALRQGDFLQAVGSFVNVRSDTFRIRAYGEARNGSVVSAQAWCEVIVQRLPGYVDPADAPEEAFALLTPGGVNATFGRQFTITSFRWLNSSEL
jgi:Tfp pilus assembly protein PilX